MRPGFRVRTVRVLLLRRDVRALYPARDYGSAWSMPSAVESEKASTCPGSDVIGATEFMSTQLERASGLVNIVAAEGASVEPQLPSRRVHTVPRIVIANHRQPPETDAPTRPYSLRYRAKGHRELPHVVKFSGGRSSGMLLFALLENRILDPDRGDVIVFNNTAAEHPGTYRFARDCKKASSRYGVPFFWVEFQTYEDSRKGEWTRLPSYRLVNDQPRSENNPDGFHWRGEVFEELLSWAGYVPNQFGRICTTNMKLEVTRRFLKDWLGCKETIPRLGHYGVRSRVDLNAIYRRHLRSQGSVPKPIFVRKRAYALSRPHIRPEQRYSNFSSVWRRFQNTALTGKVFGDQAAFGKGGVEYIAFVGLRGDEQVRVQRVAARNAGPGASGHAGEHVYMPLSDMGVTRDDVNAFWDQQPWDLSLPKEGSLSNCVYCFLKGAANLRSVRKSMEDEKRFDVPGFGSLLDTPSDVAWWTRMEQTYGRDLKAEEREITGNPESAFVGFFGTKTDFSYQLLAEAGESEIARYSGSLLPCDCTE